MDLDGRVDWKAELKYAGQETLQTFNGDFGIDFMAESQNDWRNKKYFNSIVHFFDACAEAWMDVAFLHKSFGNNSGGLIASDVSVSSKTSVLSRNIINHVLPRHTLNGMKQQIPFMTIEQIEKRFLQRTVFNPSWSNEKVILAIAEALKQAYEKKLGAGVHSFKIFGDIVNIVLKADGTLDTAYGVYKVTLEDLLK